MVVGMIPLIVAEGAGAKSRIAIGLVIAFGMSIGTLFTLFVVPSVYVLIAKDHRKERERAASVGDHPVLSPELTSADGLSTQ